MNDRPAPHETSLAVWSAPPTVVAGERFTVKVGVRSAAGCSLADGRIEVDGGGDLSTCRLGGMPWQSTGALFWSEVELRAPAEAGLCRYAVRFDAAGLAEPHRNAEASFGVTVVTRPEHRLTITVKADDGPVEDAHLRLGPYRAITGADGRASLSVAKGRYDLVVWKAGYDCAPTPLDIAADAQFLVEATAVAEGDPDARWTA